MSGESDQIRAMTIGLPTGSNSGGNVCPYCLGGRNGDKSLSVTKLTEGTILYVCHRASCGREGRIGDRVGTHYSPPSRKQEFTARAFTGAIEDIPDVIREYYIARFGFTDRQLERYARWSPDDQRTVWQVRSPVGAIRGYELRTHRDDSGPKSLHYRHSPEPWIGYSYPEPRADGPLIAVEDCISAAKVACCGFACASLMGTNLNVDKIVDLMRVNETILLALDRDATDKARKYMERFRFICPGMIVVPLQRDLKYENQDFITRLVGETLQ